MDDLTHLEPILQRYAPRGRSGLIPALHAAQEVYGYLPEAVSSEVGRALGVPLADVYGVIEFYSMFYTRPAQGKTVIRVCTDISCSLHGGDAVLEAVCQHLSSEPGKPCSEGEYRIEQVTCLGLCNHAPAVLSGESAIGPALPEQAPAIVARSLPRPPSHVSGDLRLLTANCGGESPADLARYRAGGGYQGLQRALGMPPAEVIAEVKASGLVGRGGAAFPTGVKWESAASVPAPARYVVCNADESEPGTFKDRILMEGDPHRTLEGMLITAYAIGAHQGYIYVRGEYPYAHQVLQAAAAEARQAGLLGPDILGSGFSFDIELRLGAGAYLCGEETALFESIEGKRGFPRFKPPYPTTFGLFGQPTVISNVESLCNLPLILQHGPAAYRQYGTPKSTGPKLFCLSGDIQRPGVYEVPFGVTLRRLVYDLAGGPPPGRELQALLLGGAAGVFATSDHLDLPLTYEDVRSAGLTLGSGAVVVLDDRRDLRQVLLRLGRFFAHESCGKCYPCQLGTQRQHEILQRVADGRALPGDIGRLADTGWTMTEASLCGLGQTAASAVLSALKLWPQLFQ